MASRIKGITIEIDGDATGLEKALKSVNSTIKENQSALKDTERLLKLNPGSTELLAQKQTYLTGEIDATKEKLEQEKLALAQLQNAPNASETVEQQRALAREIEDTTQKLKALTDEYKEFGSVSAQQVAAAGEKMKEIGGDIESAGRSIMPASAAMIGLGTAAVKTTADFDSSMSQVAAPMGVTTDEIKDLRDFAKEMGATTAFSASDAAEGLNILAMAGYDAEQQMAVLPSILQMASAGNLSLADSADYVTGIIAGFSNESLDATVIADKLAKTASSAKGDVASFGEGLATVAGTANTTGQSFQDMATALGILGNNNYSASEAGNALNRTLKNLYQPSSTAAEAMDALGLSAYDAQGNVRALPDVLGDLSTALDGMTDEERNKWLSKIFDAATLKSVPALLNSCSGGLNGVVGALENSGIAWEKYNDTVWYSRLGIEGILDDLIYDIRDLGLSNEEVCEYLVSEYDMTAEDATKAIETVRRSLEDQTTAWDTLSDTIEDSAGYAETAADTQLDNLEGQLTMLKSALEGLAISLGEILMPIVRGAVEKIQAVVDWLNSLDDGAKNLIVRIGLIIAAAGPLLIFIGKVATGIGSIMTLAPKIVSGFTALKATLLPIVETIKTALSGLFTLIMAHPVIAVITAIVATLVLLYTKCEWFRDGVNAVIQSVSDFFTNFGEKVTEVCEGIAQWWSDLKQSTAETWENIKTSIGDAWENLKNGAVEKFTAIKNTISEKWENIKLATSETWNNISTTVGTLTEGIRSNITDKFTSAKNKAVEIFTNMKQNIEQKIAGVRDFIKGAIDKITGFFSTAKLEFPKIKLPHFTISGKFSLDPPSIPHFGVEWYKKAYDNAYLMNSPTIFGAQGGKLLGGGDGNGSEMIVGTDLLRGMINDAVGDLQLAGGGDIIIPVSIGNERLDTLVVKATDRVNYRSGGR